MGEGQRCGALTVEALLGPLLRSGVDEEDKYRLAPGELWSKTVTSMLDGKFHYPCGNYQY